MRIRRVHAQAFGALRDETLPLADGLTVVYGRNEAGKSTWHAALLAALCGRRPVGKDDLDRYAPWSTTEWAVSAEVCLADGRRVELRHDLAARHGWATDLELGTDCAPEITAKGRGEVPDAARWLGLDRRAFAAVACVRQSDVRLATEQADGLRGYVERAATAAPGEETAAAALSLLDRFQRERVGTDKTTTKPLQVAQRSVESAEQRLQAALAQREELRARSAQARTLRARAESVAAALASAEAAAQAARARIEAARARAEAARARIEAARAQEEARRRHDRVSLAQELAVDVPLPPPPSSPLPTAPVTAPSAHGRRRAMALFGGAVLTILGAAALLGTGVLGQGAAALAGAVAAVAALALAAAGLAASRRVAVQPPPAQQPSVLDEDWLAARDVVTERRVRLESLLEGGTLADLVARAEAARHRAEQLAAAAGGALDFPTDTGPTGGGPADGGAADTGPSDTGVDADAVDELRAELREAQRLADAAEAQVAQLVRDQTPVAEAEAELEQARSAVAELMELDDVLTRTRDFLARAQTRVYRDIAPRIAAVVGRDLAAVTGGRYTEAFVDPHSLAVRVRAPGGVPRDADRLSIGTVEQVYLLLRVALAEQLVREGESCPLLLDDVTVHADAERTSRMLDVLLAVAARHQVVLFTQQEEVRRWAASTVDGNRHALRELTTLAPA